MPRRRAERQIVHFQFILNDVKHSREILQLSESQDDVLFIEIQSGDPVASRRVQSKVALLAPVLFVVKHGIAYPRQTFRHFGDRPIIENEDGRAVLFWIRIPLRADNFERGRNRRRCIWFCLRR